MDRLTIRNSDGSVSQPLNLNWAAALERLADYEDTGLEPEEIEKMHDEMVTCYDESGVPYSVDAEENEAKHIIELLEAESQGRLVVLPCKVGDTVYIASSTRGVYEAKVRTFFCGNCGYIGDSSPDVRMIRTTSCDIPMADFNKTVFLTREEAEAALKGGDKE